MNSKKKSLSAHIIDVDTLHVKYLVKRTIIREYCHSVLEKIYGNIYFRKDFYGKLEGEGRGTILLLREKDVG